MTEFRSQRWISLPAAMLLALMATSCNGGDPGDTDSSNQENLIELGLSSKKECEAAGYQELIDFFAENQIEIRDEDLKQENPSYCSISMIWEVTSDGEYEYNGGVVFGLEEFESISEAERAIERPSALGLTVAAGRDEEDLEREVPDYWDDGFIWSKPDSWGTGPTDVAARVSNVVVYASFTYSVPGSKECDGEDCAVMPSDLVEWIHSAYLPAVAGHITELTAK